VPTSFSASEKDRCKRELGPFLARRQPPAHIRAKLDIAVRVAGQSVEIVEIRPRWNRPEERHESPIAKATYVKARGLWRVFWRRHDLKWHRYDPCPTVGSLKVFGELVHEDRHHCFFG
jgi:hypothetical protein